MADHRLTLEPDIADIPRLLDWIEECCGAEGVNTDIVFKLTLALEEAAANVMHHAFADIPPPHRIDIALSIMPDRVSAEIVDNGRAFDPTEAPEPNANAALEHRDPGGLGIHLIRTMMDRVDYRRANGENRLRLQKRRD